MIFPEFMVSTIPLFTVTSPVTFMVSALEVVFAEIIPLTEMFVAWLIIKLEQVKTRTRIILLITNLDRNSFIKIVKLLFNEF